MEKILILALLLLMPAASAVAAGASGKIKAINIKETGYIFITFTSDHTNNEQCGKADMVAIPQTHIAKKEILTIVLSAFAMKREISFWTQGCYAKYGTTYPKVTSVYIEN